MKVKYLSVNVPKLGEKRLKIGNTSYYRRVKRYIVRTHLSDRGVEKYMESKGYSKGEYRHSITGNSTYIRPNGN